jgi:hypothetical protein
MTSGFLHRRIVKLCKLSICVGAVFLAGAGGGETVSDAPPVARRLTAEQYHNIIADTFGSDIDLGGRSEPDVRDGGLLAAGASKATVAPSGMEQYDLMGRKIASQVLDEKHRAIFMPCTPKVVTDADDGCARQFLSKTGTLLYRRPLSRDELDAYVLAAHRATGITKDFYNGLGLSLAAMLSSPKFLFITERTDPTIASAPGTLAMDDYSRASQLSFFLWNSSPDLPLLQAAARGELRTKNGLAAQVDRMLHSRNLERGVRAFFADNFAFSDFEVITKDPALFPEFSAQVIADAQEQMLRTIIDTVLVRRADFREIFTTKKTFLTPELAAIYRVPVFNDGPNGAPDNWQPYEFPASDPRGGILTQIAFTALHSPAGRGSATIRGKAVREVILCQKVPPPPGTVDFSKFAAASTGGVSTARIRLAAHAVDPACAGCHKAMDPIGLALENFDGQGAFRLTENGLRIDTSGELGSAKYSDAAGLGRALFDNRAATRCLVNRLASYAMGRPAAAADRARVDEFNDYFAKQNYRVPDLIREIALSDWLYEIRNRAALPAETRS